MTRGIEQRRISNSNERWPRDNRINAARLRDHRSVPGGRQKPGARTPSIGAEAACGHTSKIGTQASRRCAVGRCDRTGHRSRDDCRPRDIKASAILPGIRGTCTTGGLACWRTLRSRRRPGVRRDPVSGLLRSSPVSSQRHRRPPDLVVPRHAGRTAPAALTVEPLAAPGAWAFTNGSYFGHARIG